MSRLKLMDNKRKENLSRLIKKQWEPSFSLEDYAVYINQKDKIYIITRNVCGLDLSRLRINSVGLYFGKLKNNELRLSIEGSQLVGETAKKNILELDNKQSELWMQGQDVEIDTSFRGYVIIKHNKDFLGCGKISDKLHNYVPKERRISS